MRAISPRTKQRLRAYSWLFPSLAVVVAVAVGWSLFWFVKSYQTASALTAWMAREAQLGRAWSCPTRTIGGFPFSTAITCTGLLFQGDVRGSAVAGSLRGFRATMPLLRTGNAIARLDPPLALKSSDGALDIALQWDELAFELDSDGQTIGRMALAGSQVRLQGKAGGTDLGDGSIADVAGDFALIPDRDDHAYEVMISLHQGSIPALGGFLDTKLPIDFQLDGTVSHFHPSGPATLAAVLESWRAANGHLDVASASVKSGAVSLDAKGGLDLDGEHRVKGKLDAGFAGLDKAFRQLGIDPGLLAAGQVLSGLLGGQRSSPGRLHVPVTIAEGFLSIGPVRTPFQVPPLY